MLYSRPYTSTKTFLKRGSRRGVLVGREFVRVSRPFCEAQLPMCSARSDPHLGDLLHFGCMPVPSSKLAANTERFDLIHMYAYVFWVLQAVNTNTNSQKNRPIQVVFCLQVSLFKVRHKRWRKMSCGTLHGVFFPTKVVRP